MPDPIFGRIFAGAKKPAVDQQVDQQVDDGGDASSDDLPYDADDPLGKAIWEVGENKKAATDAVNANSGNTDDPMANLNTLQAQLKLTEAVNFAVNLMMTIHQQCMAAINKLGEAGR